jgi:glycosyl transferase family 25
MWEFVDKVVYINLDHREDRRKLMNKLFEEGGIPHEKVERFSAIRHPVGIVGCAMSHIDILKRAKQQGWKSVLVFEDDMQWIDFEQNYKKLEVLVKQPYDVCMLGGLYLETTPPKVHMAVCTNVYIVRSHYYDTLLNNFETGLRKKLDKNPPRFFARSEKTMREYYARVDDDNGYNVDTYWFKLQLKDNWMAVMPPMCDQAPTYSDIYNTVVVHQDFDDTHLRTIFAPYMKDLIVQGKL